MGTTERGYPWPEESDPPDGAAQMQALAEAVDTDVGTVEAALPSKVTGVPAAGQQPATLAVLTFTTNMTLNAGDSFSAYNEVNWSTLHGHTFTQAPVVVVSVSGAGDDKVAAKVESTTTTYVRVRLYHPTGSAPASYSVTVNAVVVGI